MGTGLGYASGLVIRQTVRNNSATVAIATGNVVSLITTGVGVSGVGDAVLLAGLSATNLDGAALGIAERDIAEGQGAATGEGEFGHVVVYGLVKVAIGVDIDANEALSVRADGTIDQSLDAEITAGQSIGVALESVDVSTGDLCWAFVNFLNRSSIVTVGGSGYLGASV